MPDDRIDWADVAAVGALARAAWHLAEVEDPVRFTLEEMSSSVEVDGIADEVSSALREAHEAGLREASATRGGLIAARQDAERRELSALADLDEATAELRALRRELAARRAVDRWLRQWNHHLEVEHDGLHVRGPNRGPFHIEAPDYPALAAALGLEVWE
jgi:hypothetical protein